MEPTGQNDKHHGVGNECVSRYSGARLVRVRPSLEKGDRSPDAFDGIGLIDELLNIFPEFFEPLHRVKPAHCQERLQYFGARRLPKSIEVGCLRACRSRLFLRPVPGLLSQ
jgi:hypothetical protein